MKNILGIIAFTLTAFITNAADYEEGEHYKVVTEFAVEQPEVREFFSFYCGHCFSFEHLIPIIKKSMPDSAQFVKSHVNFLPGASKRMQHMMTKALIVAQKLDMEEQQIASLFKYIHVHGAVPTSARDIRNVFVLNGADGDKFDRLINSDEVNKAAGEMESLQNKLAQAGDLRSVPTVIVNGKYMVTLPHSHDKNMEEEYTKIVNYLLTLG